MITSCLHMHAHACVLMHVYARAHIFVRIFIYIYLCICALLFVHMYVCMFVCVCVCMCLFVCNYICTHNYLFFIFHIFCMVLRLAVIRHQQCPSEPFISHLLAKAPDSECNGNIASFRRISSNLTKTRLSIQI